MASSSITSVEELVESARKHSALYDKGNTLYRQLATLLPSYGNLHKVSFVVGFLDHPRFGPLALCPWTRRFRLICQRPRIRTENATSTSISSFTLICSNARTGLTVLVFTLDV